MEQYFPLILVCEPFSGIRHHGGTIEGTPEAPLNITAITCRCD